MSTREAVGAILLIVGLVTLAVGWIMFGLVK
jgi:hypothetical protein